MMLFLKKQPKDKSINKFPAFENKMNIQRLPK